MFGGPTSTAGPAAPAAPAMPVLLTAEKGKGVSVHGKLSRQSGQVSYNLTISNGSSGPVDGFMVQVNSNSFGLAPANQVVAVGSIPPGGKASAQVPMVHNPAKLATGPATSKLQVIRVVC